MNTEYILTLNESEVSRLVKDEAAVIFDLSDEPETANSDLIQSLSSHVLKRTNNPFWAKRLLGQRLICVFSGDDRHEVAKWICDNNYVDFGFFYAQPRLFDGTLIRSISILGFSPATEVELADAVHEQLQCKVIQIKRVVVPGSHVQLPDKHEGLVEISPGFQLTQPHILVFGRRLTVSIHGATFNSCAFGHTASHCISDYPRPPKAGGERTFPVRVPASFERKSSLQITPSYNPISLAENQPISVATATSFGAVASAPTLLRPTVQTKSVGTSTLPFMSVSQSGLPKTKSKSTETEIKYFSMDAAAPASTSPMPSLESSAPSSEHTFGELDCAGIDWDNLSDRIVRAEAESDRALAQRVLEELFRVLKSQK